MITTNKTLLLIFISEGEVAFLALHFRKKKAPLKIIKRQSIFKYDKPNYMYTCSNMSYFGLLLVVCEIEDYEKLENEQNHAKNVASGPKYMLTAYVDHRNDGWYMFF